LLLTIREKAYWWVAIVAVLCGFVWLFQGILLPFVAGIAIAYFLDPVADRLEKRRISRGIAALIALVCFFLVAIAFLLLLVPVVQSQISELSQRLPAIIEAIQNGLTALLAHLKAVLSEHDFERLRTAITGQLQRGILMATSLLSDVLSKGMALFEFLSVVVVTPVVAFYLLRDWDKIIADLDALIPRESRQEVREQMYQVDDMLAGFARGQASVCAILGLCYGGALALAGLPFGFTVGLTAGLASFIPYLGSMFGLVVSVGLAFLEFDDPFRIGIIAAIFVVGQVIEGNYLTPKLVGERVRLHPVWVIFALFAGGSLLGFLGMLIALPVAAVIGVLVRFLIMRYRASMLYDELPPE
jgi:predicted PurR-regulated permease PerM